MLGRVLLNNSLSRSSNQLNQFFSVTKRQDISHFMSWFWVLLPHHSEFFCFDVILYYRLLFQIHFVTLSLFHVFRTSSPCVFVLCVPLCVSVFMSICVSPRVFFPSLCINPCSPYLSCLSISSQHVWSSLSFSCSLTLSVVSVFSLPLPVFPLLLFHPVSQVSVSCLFHALLSQSMSHHVPFFILPVTCFHVQCVWIYFPYRVMSTCQLFSFRNRAVLFELKSSLSVYIWVLSCLCHSQFMTFQRYCTNGKNNQSYIFV